MARQHQYKLHLNWIGNLGQGTSTYTAYRRDHILSGKGKSADIPASSDPAFRGDPARYNPEELLVASLSSCHMLWYLHLCADAGIVIDSYKDNPEGVMEETADGGGRFISVTLRPQVLIRSGDPETARQLHHQAHELCFIANSVNFPVHCEPV